MRRGSRKVCTAPTAMDTLWGRPWQRSGPQHLFTLLCVAENRDKCSKLVELLLTLSYYWILVWMCRESRRRMDLLPVVVVEETNCCAHTLEPLLKHYSEILRTHFASMYFWQLRFEFVSCTHFLGIAIRTRRQHSCHPFGHHLLGARKEAKKQWPPAAERSIRNLLPYSLGPIYLHWHRNPVQLRDQRKMWAMKKQKPWLVGVYRALYSPVIWAL